jgi:hypothetical protein
VTVSGVELWRVESWTVGEKRGVVATGDGRERFPVAHVVRTYDLE